SSLQSPVSSLQSPVSSLQSPVSSLSQNLSCVGFGVLIQPGPSIDQPNMNVRSIHDWGRVASSKEWRVYENADSVPCRLSDSCRIGGLRRRFGTCRGSRFSDSSGQARGEDTAD